MPTRVIRMDSQDGALEELAPAVRALRAGRLVAFPTETVYGLGAVATDARAVERLREVKSRPKSPFTVHLPSPGEAHRYVRNVPLRARALMAKAWPGPVTVLLPTGGRFADSRLGDKALFERICPGGVVGLRCPDHRLTLALLQRAQRPVLASSANLAGEPPPHSGEEVLAQLEGKVDLLIDGGPTRHAAASTIVAFQGEDYRIVRAGVYDAGAIDRMAGWTLLFVCAGNTCRSPMAAALARKLLGERMGVAPDRLEKAGIQVLSAGIFAGGSGATEGAVAAVARLGAKMGKHRSRKLTGELIRSADMIFCMTRSQLDEVSGMVPDASGKAVLLDAKGDIEDPLAGDDQVYLSVARRIAEAVEKRMQENWP